MNSFHSPRMSLAIPVELHKPNMLARLAWVITMLVVIFSGAQSFAANHNATQGIAQLRGAVRGLLQHASHEEALPLHAWYAERGYTPAWTNAQGLTAQGKAAVAVLATAGNEGLPPERYALGMLASTATKATADELAALDVAISRAVQRYTQDIRYGAANPNAPAMGLDGLSAAVQAPSVQAYLSKQRPSNPRYALLSRELATARTLRTARPETLRSMILALEKLRWEHGQSKTLSQQASLR